MASRSGSWWVTAQFTLLLLLGICARPSPPFTWPALFSAGLGVGLGLWVLRHNPPGNFRIRPEPHPKGHLITSGPYRWIRHPMYSALLLLVLALVLQSGHWLCALLALLLWGVLNAKSRMEERYLAERWPAYEIYMGQTWRFIPWLW